MGDLGLLTRIYLGHVFEVYVNQFRLRFGYFGHVYEVCVNQFRFRTGGFSDYSRDNFQVKSF